MQYNQNIQSTRIFTDENLAEKIIKMHFCLLMSDILLQSEELLLSDTNLESYINFNQ